MSERTEAALSVLIDSLGEESNSRLPLALLVKADAGNGGAEQVTIMQTAVSPNVRRSTSDSLAEAVLDQKDRRKRRVQLKAKGRALAGRLSQCVR